jgi:hypothetical protein
MSKGRDGKHTAKVPEFSHHVLIKGGFDEFTYAFSRRIPDWNINARISVTEGCGTHSVLSILNMMKVVNLQYDAMNFPLLLQIAFY